MAFKSFVEDAKKTNALMQQKTVYQRASPEKIIDASSGQIPREQISQMKEELNSIAKSSLNTPIRGERIGFDEVIEERPRRANFNHAQKIDPRHGNIIANVIRESGSNFSGNVTWKECKYMKEDGCNTYCREFHSLCGKDKCKRATK